MERETIEPYEGDERFVRRDDVGRSLAADQRSKSKTVAPKGMGDRGDQAKKKKS
ncbi:MAG: hypothetical protein ABI601_20165 [bacterium]